MTLARENRRGAKPPAFARRHFVLGACASAAALSLGGSLAWPPGDARAFEPPAGGGLEAFVALSQQLTGRTALDSTLARRIYYALAKADTAFTANVAALNTWLKAHRGVPSDMVTAALQADDARLAKAVAAVMRAWYLGLVGEIPTVTVVAYERALMFDPVKDVLTIPSYCRDVPFYWAQKPVLG